MLAINLKTTNIIFLVICVISLLPIVYRFISVYERAICLLC